MTSTLILRSSRSSARHFARFAAAVVVAGLLLAPSSRAAGACTSTLNAGADVGAAIDAAGGGQTICLHGGNYPDFSVRPSGRSSYVTVTSAPGEAASIGYLEDSAPSFVRFEGLSMGGGSPHGAHDLAFVNVRFRGPTTVLAFATNANIVFDRDTFDGINTPNNAYEGRLTIRGQSDDGNPPSGVSITNSHFGNGGLADGIQVIGSANGVRIGPGNEFSGIRQSDVPSGDPHHVDPIQLYGSSHTLVTGNYFHDNSTGIMMPDASSDNDRIENNVFVMDEYPWAVISSRSINLTLAHNTVVGGTLRLDDNTNVGPGQTTNAVVKDNAAAVSIGKVSVASADYNLDPGAAGPHSVRAAPRFAGGANPTSYDGFHLAPGSPGTNAADDGADIGIIGSFGSTPPGAGGGGGAPPAGGNPPAAGGGPAVGPAAPLLRRFGMTRRRFRVIRRSRKAARAPRVARGSAFRFELTKGATVRISIARLRTGRKVGKTCKSTSRRPPHGRRCLHVGPVTKLARSYRKAGEETVGFSGRIGRKALKAGRYRAKIRARTSGQQKWSTPRSVVFKILAG